MPPASRFISPTQDPIGGSQDVVSPDQVATAPPTSRGGRQFLAKRKRATRSMIASCEQTDRTDVVALLNADASNLSSRRLGHTLDD